MMPKTRFQLLICVMSQLSGRKHLCQGPDLDNGGFYYSSKGGGFGAGTTSCKRHEMSSKKCVRGGVGCGLGLLLT